MATRVTRSRRAPPPQQQDQQSRAKWNDALTEVLVDVLVDQVQKGNKSNKSLARQSWKHICDEFHRQTGLNWDKDKLRNRCTFLRRQYCSLKPLLDNDDFSWDEATGAILANNDEVWDQYIKVRPEAETFRSSGCPIYKRLCIIFSEPHSNGKYDDSADFGKGNPFGFLNPDPLSMQQPESLSESEDEAEIADEQEKYQPSMRNSTGNRKRGRKSVDDAIASAILEMAAASKLRAAAIQQSAARFSISNCVKALDDMQGIDEGLYFAALNLFDNPTAREIFLSLKVDKRLSWLYGKCTAPSSSIVG